MTPIKKWTHAGIVYDTDLPEVKYILEFNEEGCQTHELLSRLLELNGYGVVMGIRRAK